MAPIGKLRAAVLRMNKKVTVQYAAALLAGSTLLSILLGLQRDRLLNSMYLGTYKVGLDAYTAAFTVPDFMFMILVSGALSVTFIPVFNQRAAAGNKKSAWQLSSSMINLMALVTLITSVLIIIFADPIVRYLVAPGLSESGTALAVSMMRVIAVNPFLFAIAAVIASIQQAVGRFAFYALAPALYNVGIIIGTLFFTNGITIFGWELFDGGIMGVALGVVFGSVLQLVVSLIGLAGLGFDYQFKIFWKNHGFRKVLNLLPARSLDQGMDYVVTLVEYNLASRMTEGSVRALNQASTLHLAPINMIGVSISTAAYPRMTEYLAQNRVDLFCKEFAQVLRAIIWLALPVSVVTFFARGYLIHFIVNGGDPAIARVLGAFALAILFRSIYHMAARGFYARKDTKTPLYVSIFAIGLNIALAIWFTFGWRLGASGLALAQVIVSGLEVAILLSLMAVQVPGSLTRHTAHAVGRMLIAAAITAVVAYTATALFPLTADDKSFFTSIPKFGIIAGVSLSAYLVLSKMLRLPEADPVIAKLRHFFFRV